MADKIRIGVLFGGQSGEHEVSLVSAGAVMDALMAGEPLPELARPDGGPIRLGLVTNYVLHELWTFRRRRLSLNLEAGANIIAIQREGQDSARRLHTRQTPNAIGELFKELGLGRASVAYVWQVDLEGQDVV